MSCEGITQHNEERELTRLLNMSCIMLTLNGGDRVTDSALCVTCYSTKSGAAAEADLISMHMTSTSSTTHTQLHIVFFHCTSGKTTVHSIVIVKLCHDYV